MTNINQPETFDEYPKTKQRLAEDAKKYREMGYTVFENDKEIIITGVVK